MGTPGRSAPAHDPLGLFWSFTSAVLWATTFVFVRALTADGQADAFTLSAVRFVIGALVLLVPALTVFRRRFLAVPPRDLLAMAGLSLLGMCGMSVLLFIGQSSTTATNGALIMQLSPLLMLLLTAALGERVTARQALGIGIALGGSLLIGEVWRAHGHWRGDLLILASAGAWALYSVLGRGVVARHGGFVTTTWAMLFGGILLFAVRLALPLPWPAPEPAVWGMILYIGLFPTGVAFVAWYEAIHRLDFNLVNVMQYITPACAILFAWWWLDERLSPFHWLGIAVMAAGILLVSLPGNAKPAAS
ncbi:MAG TPA: DMT family transporter [Armatimonadota bacterium]|nr:DMT family transporter [Armatimonadota bacterium]